LADLYLSSTGIAPDDTDAGKAAEMPMPSLILATRAKSCQELTNAVVTGFFPFSARLESV